MFEAGKEYDFVTLEAGEQGPEQMQRRWIVKKVDGNILHLHIAESDDKAPWVEYLGKMPEQNMILNTGSAFFHSATPVTKPQHDSDS